MAHASRPTQAFASRFRRAYRDLVIHQILTPSSRMIDGMPQPEMFLLAYVLEDGPLSQLELRRRFWPLGEDQVSKLVKSLLQKKFITHTRDKVDARVKRIALTASGKAEALRRQEVGIDAVRDLLLRHTPEEQGEFLSAIETINRLRAKVAPLGPPPRDSSESEAQLTRAYAKARRRKTA